MYSLRSNDRDGRSKLDRMERRNHFLANSFQVLVELRFWGEYCTAPVAQSLDSKKIDCYFFETFVCVDDIFVILVKCSIEAFGLIFYLAFIKLICPFFVSFLVAAIGWIWLLGLARCTLGGGTKLTRWVVIGYTSCSAYIVRSWLALGSGLRDGVWYRQHPRTLLCIGVVLALGHKRLTEWLRGVVVTSRCVELTEVKAPLGGPVRGLPGLL